MIDKILIKKDIKSAIAEFSGSDEYVFKFDSMHGFMFKHNHKIYIIEYHHEDIDDRFYICLHDIFSESVCDADYIDDNQLFFIEIINVNGMKIVTELNCFLNVDIEAMISMNDFTSVATTIYFDHYTFDPERDNCQMLPKLNRYRS